MSGVQEADSDRLESKSRQSLIQQAIARQHSGVGSGHPSTRAGTIKMSTRASTIAEGLRDYVVAVIQGKGERSFHRRSSTHHTSQALESKSASLRYR